MESVKQFLAWAESPCYQHAVGNPVRHRNCKTCWSRIQAVMEGQPEPAIQNDERKEELTENDDQRD